MNKKVFTILLSFVISAAAQADSLSRLEKKANDAAAVIEEVVRIPEQSIPRSLLDRAVCVATIPNVIKIGFVFGARFGQGLVSCRVPGGWSQPSFLKVTGGSWGAQIGFQSIDLVLVFVNSNAVQRLSQGNLTVGIDASLAAGPIGRDAQIGTDFKLQSEIYSYSKTKGLFAGIILQGTALTVDRNSNALIYANSDAGQILRSNNIRASSVVSSYVNSLERFAH